MGYGRKLNPINYAKVGSNSCGGQNKEVFYSPNCKGYCNFENIWGHCINVLHYNFDVFEFN